MSPVRACRAQLVVVALAGAVFTAFAAAADVYYTLQDGVYVLSNVQQTEQFQPALTEGTAGVAGAAGAGTAVAPGTFQPTAFESLLVKYCARYGVDINLVKAVMLAESGMRHTNDDGSVRTSDQGAMGIMQVMPATGASLGLSNLADLETNIHAGIRYLSLMQKRFAGDVVKTVAAYNAGPGAVEEHGGIPPYPETRNYVQVVLKAYQTGNFTGGEDAPAPVTRPLRQFTDRRGNVVLTNIY